MIIDKRETQKCKQKGTANTGGARAKREARAPPRVARYIFDYIFEFRAYFLL